MREGQLTLGQLIIKLREVKDQDQEVYYDSGYMFPTSVMSWRGDYAELAMDYYGQDEHGAKPVTTRQLIEILEDAVNSTFTGYKGGEYIMSVHTPVWVSNWGESAHTAVLNVLDLGYQTIICTGFLEY